MPKVSVIIPAYNSMKYLPQTLESVLQQDFTDFEVLIVNDGSSDQIEQWAAQLVDPRVRLISQENQGVSAARNAGIAQAKGEYVAFLDADDLWEPTKLAKQVQCLDSNPEVGLVHTWMFFADEQGKSTGRVLPSDAEGWVWERLAEKNLVACSSVMVRQACFESVGVFDSTLIPIEDWDLWIRIASRYPFAVIREPLMYYRKLPTSISTNCKLMEKSFCLLIEKVFQSAPPDLQLLKPRSYGHAYLCLAWKALQSADRDYNLAISFQKKALTSYPKARFSKENLRLSLAISLMRLFGSDRYTQTLSLLYKLRQSALQGNRSSSLSSPTGYQSETFKVVETRANVSKY
ncbi:glycosyltransferase family 2 protein [Kovacikia minuta CCNUW1]|uniref:glycosyltransferase family 2 protein n=1 Tax=Kovacikia minuta TaxID=2931930 RepID=UPI001CCF9244|nr:glycosyltransferase family A protein [Kovacikia minuta]UBF29192.1 glycosyltransferase family 2 protein [Kovacikia minuta CCNUW1]